METEESNICATPCKTLVTQKEALHKSFPPHCSTPKQVYQNSWHPATPLVNSYAAEFLHSHIWESQKYGMPVQYETQHNSRSLSNHLSDGASLRISEREKSNFNDKGIDSRTLCDGKLQPGSITSSKSREKGTGSSVSNSARDRPACVSSDEGHGIDHTNNNQDFLIKRLQCDEILAKDGAAGEEAADIKNFNTVHASKNSASEGIAVNLAENANLGNNVIEAKPQLSKLEEDEIRRERKRQLNRESAKRSRLRKQQELVELQNTVDDLIRQNSALKKKLKKLSEDCLELSDSSSSIERELIEQYGPEIIADIVATKPVTCERPEIVKEENYQNPSTDVIGQS